MTKLNPGTARRSIRIGLLASSLLSLAASPLLHAKDRIPNLGGGLEEMAAQAGARSLGPARRSAGPSLPQLEPLITMDSSGRPLVQISMNGKMPGADTLQALAAMPGVEIVATDMGYRAGVVEAYVPPGMLVSIAKHGGVLAVVPSSPAVTNVGAVDSQGIVQHRVDQIEGVDGAGITIGIMSDSYDTSANAIKEADDIASGDLPGPGNPFGNTEPVVIIEDFPGGSGRRSRHGADRARHGAQSPTRIRDCKHRAGRFRQQYPCTGRLPGRNRQPSGLQGGCDR